jgi:hypothetical protein
MPDFTRSSFEGSLLSSIVYSDEIEPGMTGIQFRNALAEELSDAEIQYFLDNFKIVDTTDFKKLVRH